MSQAKRTSVTLVIDDSFDLEILCSPRYVPRTIMGAKASDPEKVKKDTYEIVTSQSKDMGKAQPRLTTRKLLRVDFSIFISEKKEIQHIMNSIPIG